MLADSPLVNPASDWWQTNVGAEPVPLNSVGCSTEYGPVPPSDGFPVEQCSSSLEVNRPIDEKELSTLEAELFQRTYYTREDPLSCPPLTDEGERRIEEFIDSCGLYDRTSSRWVDLPEDPTSSDFFQEAFQRILNTLLVWSNVSANRTIVCLPRETRQFNAFPALAMCITSLSGHRHGGTIPGYQNYATPIEMKLEKDRWLASDIIQSAIYAKQCFLQQHNRDMVPCLLLTEKHVQVFIFDKNGVTLSYPVHIHKNPLAFVRIAIQASGALGFDPSVFWKEGARYVSYGSTSLRIIGDSPIYINPKLVGEGSTCWKVMDEQGRICLARSFATRACKLRQELEWMSYRDTQGLPGVGRMVGHYEGTFLSVVKQPRLVNCPHFFYPLLNKKCYLFLEHYERSILQFNDRMELLCAFRDAIAGHANLWRVGIWHRDIRPKNVRIGQPGSSVGRRGVLVGLKRAKRIGPNPAAFSYPNYLTGDNTFKSISLLTSTVTPIHTDYLDDLESFFYILCYVCSVYQGPQTTVDQISPWITDWDSDDPLRSATVKNNFLSTLRPDDLVTPYFGETFSGLIQNLRKFLVTYMWIRFNVFNQVPHLRQSPPEVDYANFLQYFDDAIRDLDVEESTQVDDADLLSYTSSVSSPEIGTPDTMIGLEDVKDDIGVLIDLGPMSSAVSE
ncbi:hypothetical protein GALMADRAFT_387683, partial [Galerina marginata CBS 339.88]